ncbi:hypothetical protein BDZ97DRAFT_723606 [Flammula alnicola]|nr:hypothetical protein BDZ97DRAFT_723606 [Flammula alnicola]
MDVVDELTGQAALSQQQPFPTVNVTVGGAATNEGPKDLPAPRESSTNCPIDLLSQDLLTLILEYNMVRDATDTEESPHLIIPVVVSQVSRFWRFVALETPLRWRRLSIFLPWNLDEDGAYLKRSKQCPIELGISMDPKDIATPQGLINGGTTLPSPLNNYGLLRELLSLHLQRCRVLHIRGSVLDKMNKIFVAWWNRCSTWTCPF